MKTIFMGTPQFAVPALQLLSQTQHKPVLVVTQPDRPKGRKRRLQPPPVKSRAEELNLTVFQPEDVNLPENITKIAELQPELIITVAYGGFLRKKIRNLPKFKCINLHPSLLPLYRGAAPINYALFNDDTQTGISIFQLIAKMDAGPLLWQRNIRIEKQDNYTSLSRKLAREGALDLIKIVDNIEQLYENKTAQDETKATYSRKIEKADKFIQWHQPRVKIVNLIRGLSEVPGAVAKFRQKPIKIIEAEAAEGTGKPGEVVAVTKAGIIIAAENGCMLIKRVQPAGKKIMTARAYDLGARIEPGEKFTDGN